MSRNTRPYSTAFGLPLYSSSVDYLEESMKSRSYGYLLFRRLLPVLICAVCIGACLNSANAQTAALRIGIIGDQTGSPNIDESYKTLKKGIDILKKEKIDVAIHTGDLVESSQPAEAYRNRFATAVDLLNQIGKPWHLSPGDHDVNPDCYIPDSSDRTKEDLYKTLYREKEPGLTDTLSHSFDIKGYHFISLNALEHLHSDSRWGDIFLDRVSVEQLNWLKADLEKHRTAKGIIVFLHHPMWYNWSGWKAVHNLLRTHNTLAVIAGHFHYPQDEGSLDNIHYFVVGATGGDISRYVKTISRNAGAVQHVTVMTVSGRKVAFKLIALDDNRDFNVGTREDMDRVQTIVTSFGEIGQFAVQNKISVEPDGRIYGPNMQRASLMLKPIGNPIDLPVKISVKLDNEKLSLVNASFLVDPASPRESCQKVEGEQCVLGPSARVALANLSSVSFIEPLYLCDSSSRTMRPLWESGLEIKAGKTVSAGDLITVTIRISFQSPRGEFFVEQSATTKVIRGDGL